MALLERFKIMSGCLSKKGSGAGNHPPDAGDKE